MEPFLGCVLCDRPALYGVCDDHKVSFNQAWVAGVRSGPLQRLIGGFKFRNMKEAASNLGELLDATLPPLPSSAVIVPIPTTTAHIRERGYDHMLLVANVLGRLRHRPVRRALVRDDHLTQHRANRQERFKQAATAFMVEGTINPEATYIIVDDIVTTGATIQRASSLLHQAGAQTIWVAIIARQPID